MLKKISPEFAFALLVGSLIFLISVCFIKYNDRARWKVTITSESGVTLKIFEGKGSAPHILDSRTIFGYVLHPGDQVMWDTNNSDE